MSCVLVPDQHRFFNRNKEKESLISIQTENKESQKDFSLLLPNITIWNLEHKLKVCHSPNTAVGLDRCGIIGISHT